MNINDFLEMHVKCLQCGHKRFYTNILLIKLIHKYLFRIAVQITQNIFKPSDFTHSVNMGAVDVASVHQEINAAAHIGANRHLILHFRYTLVIMGAA